MTFCAKLAGTLQAGTGGAGDVGDVHNIPDFANLGLYRAGECIQKHRRLHYKLIYQQQRVLHRHRLDLRRVVIHLRLRRESVTNSYY